MANYSTMVDINNSYSLGNIDCGAASMNSYGSLNLDDINLLENLDENDFFNNCQEFNYSFLPDTPPETPVNYNNFNGQVQSPGQSFSPGVNLSSDSSLSSLECTLTNSQLNTANISPVQNNPITNAALIVPQSTIVQNPTTLSTCNSSSLLINCQPVLSTSDLNGFKLNGTSLIYSQLDSSLVRNVQPKTILPNKTSPDKQTSSPNVNPKNHTLEARKLRNRESAINSRLKKKEYVDTLEVNIKKLTKEKNELLTENKILKQKVKDLESQLYNLMRLDINGNYESNKKAKISFFAVIFMVCFQVSPYLISMAPTSGNSTEAINKQLMPVAKENSQKIGRTLLWSTESGEMPSDYYDQVGGINSKSYNLSSEQYANKSIRCNDYFNVSESMRLENELRGWFTRFKLEQKNSQPKARRSRSNNLPKSRQTNNKKLLFDSKYVPIPRLKLWMQKQKYGDYLPEEFEQTPEELSNGFDYESLLATLHRRDDTFYYLSYPSKGHLILPPISNRTDVRPRFSFLIPTINNLSLDDSHRNSSLKMNNDSISPQMFILQIDCQVVNTKVTLIKDDARFHNKTDKLERNKRMSKLPNANNGRK